MPSVLLALENGSLFYGESIGVPGQTVGEVVFNTARQVTRKSSPMRPPRQHGQAQAHQNGEIFPFCKPSLVAILTCANSINNRFRPMANTGLVTIFTLREQATNRVT